MKCPICKQEKFCLCKTSIIIFALILILGVGLIYFNFNKSSKLTKIKTSIGENSAQNNSQVQANSAKTQVQKTQVTSLPAREITVIGTEFSFEPSSIKVKKGERIRLTFKNQGRAIHNLVIPDLNVRTSVIPGNSQEVIEFVADKTGDFVFYCSVPGHRSAGMEGDLQVQ